MIEKNQEIKLRYYQRDAINAVCNNHFENGIIVLPTGAGKSIVISEICKYYKDFNIIVLQPSKEILIQNYQKYNLYSNDCSIFSASLNKKEISRVCFAMVKSAMNKINEFCCNKEKIIIIDECHLVADYGVYDDFIRYIQPKKIIGLTATPYRMRTTHYDISYYILTRTKRNIFKEFSYIYQNKQILRDGFWCNVLYFFENYNFDQDDLEVGSSDFKERAIAKKNIELEFEKRILNIINETRQKHILIFLTTILECEILAEYLKKYNISCENVNSKTPAKDRANYITQFKQGKIKVIINVGVLTTGFDFPELDCIILARPTLSISLYYQMVGRGLRIAKDKESCHIYDLCGNVKRFGRVEEFMLIGDDNKYLGLFSKNKCLIKPPKSFFRKRGIILENTLEELEKIIITFGKYKGEIFKNIPISYLRWCIENKTALYKEMSLYIDAKNGQTKIDTTLLENYDK